MGLWIGCDLGYVFMITALLVYYLRVDWPEMARIAQEKAAQDAKRGDIEIPSDAPATASVCSTRYQL